MKAISIDRIKRSKEIQPREALDDDTVDDYAYILKKEKGKWPFPPVTVYDDGETLWLASGFHRVAAAEIAKRSSVPAEVVKGTMRDALLFAAGTNADHGKRRTNADKRYVVQRFLEDAEWSQRSANWIAAQCKVSDQLVLAVKREIFEKSGSSSRTCEVQARDGKTYPANKPKAQQAAPQPASGPVTDDEIPFGGDAHEAPEPTASIVKDGAGRDVPDHLRDKHATGSVLAAIGRKVDIIKREAVELADQDGGWFIPVQEIELMAKDLKDKITDAGYWTSCPRCKGNGCKRCDDSGFIPKSRKGHLSAEDKEAIGA